MNHFELFRESLRTFSALSRSRSRRGSWSRDVVPIHLQTVRGLVGEWMTADAEAIGGVR